MGWSRDFFDLTFLNAGIVVSSLGGAALAVAGLWLTDDRFVPNLRGEEPAERPVP
jgi:hypothetical protein